MIGEGIVSKQTGIPGWHSDREAEALIQLARQYVPQRDGIIVELGVEYGKSTSEFAYAVQTKPNTRVVSVDLFPDNHHIAGQHGGLFAVWRRNLEEYVVQNLTNVTIVPMRGVTWEVGDNWNEPIDLLFVDAGHTYEEVTKDITAWVHHVKPGGVVIYHDYAVDENSHPLHFEVRRAVDEWATKSGWPNVLAVDSLVAFENDSEPEKNIYEQPTVERSVSTDQDDEKATTAVKEKSAIKTRKRTAKGAKKVVK